MVGASGLHFSYLIDKQKVVNSDKIWRFNQEQALSPHNYRRGQSAPGESLEEAARGPGARCPGLELPPFPNPHPPAAAALSLRFSVWFRVSLKASKEENQ